MQVTWIFICASVTGAGAWAAQFLTFLALHARFAIGYEPVGTFGALLISAPVIAGGFSLAWLGRGRWRPVVAGLIIALGLVAMRYVLLRACSAPARLAVEPTTLACAILLGGALAAAALAVGGAARTLRRQVLGGLLLATAIVATHLVGARALFLIHDPWIGRASDAQPGFLIAIPIVLLGSFMILTGLAFASIDEALQRSIARRLQRMADVSREGIVVLWADGRIADCNTAFVTLTQRPLSDLVGSMLIGPLVQIGDATLRHEFPAEGVLIADDGEHVPVEVLSRRLVEAKEETLPPTVILLRDLREQKAAEKRIRYLAEHDLQTGLPNRTALTSLLHLAHSRHMTDDTTVVLAVFTVSNSKEISELHGIDAGEAMLAQAADRLKRFAGETGHAARLGGSDFAYVGFGAQPPSSPGGASQDNLDAVEQLCKIVARPVDYKGVRLEPKVAFGAAVLPHDASNAGELLAHAESALDRAKQLAGSNICFFTAEVHDALRQQRQLAQELQVAIAEDQLVLFYQPQADTHSCEITGFEALVRWRHPVKGLLSPDRFIPVAESEGLIGSLGEWVLRRACMDAASWKQPLSVAVNLSPLQIGGQALPKRVHEILIETGMPPARLELEVTESALLGDQQHALDTLRRLKALGLRIAMDDFGTGYSSLSSLHSFPFDKLKIDKSFVEGIGKLERSTVLVRAVLGIGRGLGVPVVAEGVETAEQLAFLRAEDCASVQGYYIGKPAPVQAYVALTGDGRMRGEAATESAWRLAAR